MVSVSLCMIVKNEQTVLERCLKSIYKFADEIIIVDTGSVDKTKDISKKYAQVYDFQWCDDFSKARNFAFSKAKSDYIMWLDADDIVPYKSLVKLIEWKQGQVSDHIDVVMMPYHINIDENGRAGFIYYRERILRRKTGFVWQGAVHECIQTSGNIIYLNAPIEHHKIENNKISDRNLKIYQKQGNALDARGKFYYARELLTHGMIDDAIKMFEDFLQDKDAWIENKIEAYRNLSSCYIYKDKIQTAKDILLKSFAVDIPRAETCCDLAMIYMRLEEYNNAKFWYEIAYKCMPNTQNGGFVSIDCYGYLPCIGLCVCYDKLGDKKNANYWNERASIFKPDSEAVMANRAYFGDL